MAAHGVGAAVVLCCLWDGTASLGLLLGPEGLQFLPSTSTAQHSGELEAPWTQAVCDPRAASCSSSVRSAGVLYGCWGADRVFLSGERSVVVVDSMPEKKERFLEGCQVLLNCESHLLVTNAARLAELPRELEAVARWKRCDCDAGS